MSQQDNTLWWLRDAATILKQNGSDTHAMYCLEAADRLAAAEDRAEKAEEALKPFAAYAEYLNRDFPDHADDVICTGPLDSTITFGDFRRAFARIAKEPTDVAFMWADSRESDPLISTDKKE